MITMIHDSTFQLGVNGLGYAAKTKYLYYTSTNKKLSMRVRIDPNRHDAAGEPGFVADAMMGAEFCIDETPGIAYVATHRQNTIDRVALEPSKSGDVRHMAKRRGGPLHEAADWANKRAPRNGTPANMAERPIS
jgi:hypothetical protein